MAEMSQTEGTTEVLSQANPEAPKVKNAKGDERPIYEVGFHLVPTLSEDGVANAFDALRSELAKHKVETIKEIFPHTLALAYIIERSSVGKREKYSEAYFGSIKFAIDKEAIAAVETYLRANKDILRYLLIETVREDNTSARRITYNSDRLEGETIKKPVAAAEEGGVVSEEELDKSIDALVAEK